jgi:hypothetical protein
MARAIIDIARSQLGASESPRGSNMGAQIYKYKASTWLSPNTAWPWCVGFWQWTVRQAFGKPFPYQTAGVAQIAEYARDHGLTTSSPKVGDAGCFGGDHITFVDSLSGGSFVGLGGNQGDMVKRSSYSTSSVTTWISSEKVGVFLGTRAKQVPKKPRPPFEIVKGEGGQEKRVATANTLNKAITKATWRLKKMGQGVIQIRKNPRRKKKKGGS